MEGGIGGISSNEDWEASEGKAEEAFLIDEDEFLLGCFFNIFNSFRNARN
jgi:hypothetical protein